MHGIMLVNQAGETVASVGWESLEGDVAVFGGFLSAIQMFSKNLAGDALEELCFGDMKILIGSALEYQVVTLHEANETDAIENNRNVSKLILESGDVEYNDGFLSLIKEMISIDSTTKQKVNESVKEWTETEAPKALQNAKDWGNTVF